MSLMKSYRVAIINLGCRVNRYESDAVAQQFYHAGFQLVDPSDEADVYIVNTCAVTAEASRKSGQMLRRARQKNQDAIVVSMGCLSALEGEHKDADLSIGSKGKSRLLCRIEDLLKEREQGLLKDCEQGLLKDCKQSLCSEEKICRVHKPEGKPDGSRFSEFEEFGSVIRQSETRAFVKIQDGCNQFCSYCTIPLARGRVCSRDPKQILQEARLLAEAGFQELTLTGIHVCSYGLDLDNGEQALMDLCDRLAEIEGIKRLRFGSVEPLSVNHDFVTRMAANSKLCHHLHMSLQSGSSAVLKRMKRNYSAEQFAEVSWNLRAAMPDFLLTTDVIVAFPGETEEEHLESLRFAATQDFAHMHIFRYSRRPHTLAATMPQQVDSLTSVRRSKEFMKVAQEMRLACWRALQGTYQMLLIEEIQESIEGRIGVGYTDTYLPVHIHLAADSDVQLGEIRRLRIEAVGKDALLAYC